MRDSVAAVHGLVAALTPFDAVEAAHRAETLQWLEGTDDVFRRTKPDVPARHLVSYVVVLDPHTFDVFLVDHVNAGLSLPPGGHVEPDEHPVAAARRECREELGIEACFGEGGERPQFVTATTTIGVDAVHTDVSLWFVLLGSRGMDLQVDEVEFRGARWWSLEEVTATDAMIFDPHFGRFLEKMRSQLAR